MADFNSPRLRSDISVTRLSSKFYDLTSAPFVGVHIADRAHFALSAEKAWDEFARIGASGIGVGKEQFDAFHADLKALREGRPYFNDEVLIAARVQSTLFAWLERLPSGGEVAKRIGSHLRAARDGFEIYRVDSQRRLSAEHADAAMASYLQTSLGRPSLLIDFKVIPRAELFPEAVDYAKLEKQYPPSAAEQRLDAAYLPKRTQKIPVEKLPSAPIVTLSTPVPSVNSGPRNSKPISQPIRPSGAELRSCSAKLGFSLVGVAISGAVAVGELMSVVKGGLESQASSSVLPSLVDPSFVVGASLAVGTIALVSTTYHMIRLGYLMYRFTELPKR